MKAENCDLEGCHTGLQMTSLYVVNNTFLSTNTRYTSLKTHLKRYLKEKAQTNISNITCYHSRLVLQLVHVCVCADVCAYICYKVRNRQRDIPCKVLEHRCHKCLAHTVCRQ